MRASDGKLDPRALATALALYGLVPAAIVALATLPDFDTTLRTVAYVDGATPLFADRPYVNTARHAALDGLVLLPVPRHARYPIELEVTQPLTVYRLLAEVNDNTPFTDWEPVPGAVEVVGGTATHTRIVRRRFPAGALALAAGGPYSSNPVLLDTQENGLTAATAKSQNKLVKDQRGWATFFRGNRRKLAAIALFFALNALVVWRARRRLRRRHAARRASRAAPW